jgi:hypothetical protein
VQELGTRNLQKRRPDRGGVTKDREQLRIESSADSLFGLGFLAMWSKVEKPCIDNGQTMVG